ncbi:MAG: hypothetical protein PHD04_02235 [Candidatus Pacebacteria bacterium]|nr:hypothetical protein [Candidatus Paceibacterota bacterium]
MTNRKESFEIGEWYHCYNRSIEERIAYTDAQDYHRFLELLYLANDELPLRRDDIGIRRFEEVLAMPRGKRLVTVGAFCLMPNKFDLVLKEVEGGGITTFMRKLGTAYTLYFNARHSRAGNLFLKPFKSRHVLPHHPLQQLIHYVHSSPAVLYEPKWKTNHVVDPEFLEEHLTAYPYASLGAYTGAPAPIRAILDAQLLSETRMIPLQKMLREARHYSADSGIS